MASPDIVSIAQSTRVSAPSVADTALPPPTAAPNELAAARFSAIMNAPTVAAPAEAASATSTTSFVENSVAVGGSEVPQSLGDRMLASLQTRSDDFNAMFEATKSQLQTDQSMGMRELMALQLQVTQMSVQYEMLGKFVSRATQNVDQLVRIQ
ncbi:MAG: type III secretion system inner rod subunit SctI [Comamonadaceae bacterium]|nr:type III secretion system inner rod subunit SctI [Comamonadaceae bacterium]